MKVKPLVLRLVKKAVMGSALATNRYRASKETNISSELQLDYCQQRYKPAAVVYLKGSVNFSGFNLLFPRALHSSIKVFHSCYIPVAKSSLWASSETSHRTVGFFSSGLIRSCCTSSAQVSVISTVSAASVEVTTCNTLRRRITLPSSSK